MPHMLRVLLATLVLTVALPAVGQEEDPDVEDGSETSDPSVKPIPEYQTDTTEDDDDSEYEQRKRVWLDQQSGLFGIGFNLGNPAGVTGKVWVTPAHGVQFNLGGGPTGNNIRFTLDYAYHWRFIEVPDPQPFAVPFYVGVGVSAGFTFDDPTLRGATDPSGNPIDRDRVDLGIRIPIGFVVLIGDMPLEIAIEVAPDLVFYEDFVAFIDGGLAVRYYF